MATTDPYVNLRTSSGDSLWAILTNFIKGVDIGPGNKKRAYSAVYYPDGSKILYFMGKPSVVIESTYPDVLVYAGVPSAIFSEYVVAGAAVDCMTLFGCRINYTSWEAFLALVKRLQFMNKLRTKADG